MQARFEQGQDVATSLVDWLSPCFSSACCCRRPRLPVQQLAPQPGTLEHALIELNPLVFRSQAGALPRLACGCAVHAARQRTIRCCSTDERRGANNRARWYMQVPITVPMPPSSSSISRANTSRASTKRAETGRNRPLWELTQQQLPPMRWVVRHRCLLCLSMACNGTGGW
jgi:hypothetical protein